jgi:hypothetical protein
MGTNTIDAYSFGHFIMGAITFFLVTKLNIPVLYNFLLCNGLHLFIEYFEHNYSPDNRLLESQMNHITDVLLFLIGWLISMYFKFQNYIPNSFIPLLWFITLVIFFEEIYRELYPNDQIVLVYGAYL